MDTDLCKKTLRRIKVNKIILTVVLCVLVVAVAVPYFCIILKVGKYPKKIEHIPDTNGEINELQVITDEMASKVTEEYYHENVTEVKINSETKRKTERKGEKEYKLVIQGNSEIGMYDKTEYHAYLLSGVYCCNSIKGSGEEILFSAHCSYYRGNFKVVLMEDGKIIHNFTYRGKESHKKVKTKDKSIYEIKIIAESAENVTARTVIEKLK